MGASALMSLGIRAMAANYAALQTSGHNIANANVKGYSRQQVDLVTAQGQFTGAGFFGKGVDVFTVSRLHNEFLTRESDAANALSAMDAARLSHLRRMENVFQPGENGLGAAASELFAALSDMGSNPSDLATRQVVLARAGDLASRFAAAGAALDEVQAGVTAELRTSVTQINTLAAGIAQANERIAAMKGLGQTANDLLDERERLIAQLSEHVQVTRIEAEDGTMALFIGGGQRLVLGNDAERLSVVRDLADPTRSAIAVQDGAALRPLEHTTLGGGKIAGLLRFQNEDLGTGRNLVGQLALAVGGALNEQQLAGANLMPPLGSVASREMFAFGASAGLAHGENARDPAGNPIGSATLTIADPAAVAASDYELCESTAVPGAWDLTRLSDGLVRTIANGDTVDGVTISIANAQPGDRFLLQPTARAANGMQTVLRDPRELAAASPLLATTLSTNTGSAAVAGLRVTAQPLPFPGMSETITFSQLVPPVNVAGKDWHYEYTSALGGGPTYWNAGDPLVGGNGFTLTVAGSPATGDVINVDPTPASALLTNNGNALSLVALRDAALVGGHGYADAWSHALAEVGVRAQSADVTSTMSTAVATQAEQARSGAAGVNLDEEAARLIQFQQSYQAAAKVLQIAQSLFDTLLQTAAR